MIYMEMFLILKIQEGSENSYPELNFGVQLEFQVSESKILSWNSDIHTFLINICIYNTIKNPVYNNEYINLEDNTTLNSKVQDYPNSNEIWSTLWP